LQTLQVVVAQVVVVVVVEVLEVLAATVVKINLEVPEDLVYQVLFLAQQYFTVAVVVHLHGPMQVVLAELAVAAPELAAIQQLLQA
jgi:hypothetical protein